MDLTQYLVAAGSEDLQIRTAGEEKLREAYQSNLSLYLTGLCTELGTEQRPPAVRQLAGILLKNALVVSGSEQSSHKLAQRWKSLPDVVRTQIKGMLLQISMSNEKAVRRVASMVTSEIASIEIPANQWPDIIGILVSNARSQDINVRESSFETLGFICEKIPDSLSAYSNDILTAISLGMSAAEQNEDIKLAATTALLNSLEFVKGNMARVQERGVIMNMIFAATSSGNVKTREAAFSCLATVGGLYYDYLAPFMASIFEYTANAIQNECDEVANQAIEFWSTVCDEELVIAEEVAEAQERGEKAPRASLNIISVALPNIVPMLLKTLTKQNEDVSDDTWNIASSAGTCLSLCAQTAQNNIVQYVLPFVFEQINSANWRFREAATLAFGCILDGPEPKKLAELVSQAFPVILKHLNDENDVVKDTAAWTIGRICHLLPEAIPSDLLPVLMSALQEGLKRAPKVASHVCWAIHCLASAVQADDDQDSHALSPYFVSTVQALLLTTEREDVDEANLLTSAWESVNVLISTAASGTHPQIALLLPALMKKLFDIMQKGALTAEEKTKQNEAQALLCGTLQAIVQKLSSEELASHFDGLMHLFLSVLQAKSATVHEEAFMAIGAVANRTGANFAKYFDALQPSLYIGLRNGAEYSVCTVAVGLVGDISRALEAKLPVPFTDEVMQILLSHLQNDQIELSVKPHIIACMGDIALALGPVFERYVQFILPMLHGASTLKFTDDDDVDYLNELRQAILETYTSLLHSLDAALPSLLAPPALLPTGQPNRPPFLNSVVEFLTTIRNDGSTGEGVLRAAVGLIGDLVAKFPPQTIAPVVRVEAITDLIKQASSDEWTSETKQIGTWVSSSVKKLLKNSA